MHKTCTECTVLCQFDFLLDRVTQSAAEYAAQTDRIVSDVLALTESELLNQMASAHDDTIGSAQPTFSSESKLAGWSWWTVGTVTIGERDAKAGSPGMDISTEDITLGLDGPTERYGIVGASITLGQNDTTIGSDGSEIGQKKLRLCCR